MSTSSRRTFIAAGTAFSLGRVLGANDKINIGIVGIGGRGNDHIKGYATLPNARIAALCDINQAALETGQAAARKLARKCGPGRGRATSSAWPPMRSVKRMPWTVPFQPSADTS